MPKYSQQEYRLLDPEKLRKARAASGMTMGHFARRMREVGGHGTRMTVWAWETGRSSPATADALFAAAAVLRVTPVSLMAPWVFAVHDPVVGENPVERPLFGRWEDP